MNSDSITTILCSDFLPQCLRTLGGAKHLTGSQTQKKCCLSPTRQIKTSFMLYWHSSYHCSKHSHGRSGVKLSPYPDIVGMRKDIHSQLYQVSSPYSALLELFRQVTPALTQPPPPPRPRPTPNLTVSLSLSPQGVHSTEAILQGR